MNNNQRANQIAIKQFRKELSSMLGDIRDIDKKILDKSVNEGLVVAKKLTNPSKGGNVVEFTTKDGEHVRFTTSLNRVGGFMRESWGVTPTRKTKKGASKSLKNTADYSSYVNYGHRIVQGGVTKGFVKGQFMLEKAIHKVDKTLLQEFKKEVERVNREHVK